MRKTDRWGGSGFALESKCQITATATHTPPHLLALILITSLLFLALILIVGFSVVTFFITIIGELLQPLGNSSLFCMHADGMNGLSETSWWASGFVQFCEEALLCTAPNVGQLLPDNTAR